jgi:hypothetical protein
MAQEKQTAGVHWAIALNRREAKYSHPGAVEIAGFRVTTQGYHSSLTQKFNWETLHIPAQLSLISAHSQVGLNSMVVV